MRPLIVGELNPFGRDDCYALYPAPDGCSGHRLCCLILGMRCHTYLEAFDRVNLCSGQWRTRNARRRARELIRESGPGRKFILCGAKVSSAFGLPFNPGEVTDTGRESLLILPHPSGLNRLWAEAGAFERFRGIVATFAPEVAPLLGAAAMVKP
jgi:hypothetical protein